MSQNNKDYYDLVIIGAGIAGMTGALYAARAKLHFLILEKQFYGGQGNLTHRIENFPGFKSISGSELMQNIHDQLNYFGVSIRSEEVVAIDSFKENVLVKTTGASFESKFVIMATGATHKTLSIPGEKEFTGRGVSYCGTCDAPFFSQKNVVVIGGGNTALEEALFLAKFAEQVTIIHRRNSLRGLKILEDEARRNSKISFIFNTIIKEIHGSDTVERVILEDLVKKRTFSLKTDGVFVFIGYCPQTNILKDIVSRDDSGYIITNDTLESSHPRILAAGDARSNPLKQLITAAADGAIAAYSVIKKITGYY
ncbi:thioredoxin-disulfide reductase [Chlamydiota bacterium]